MPNLATISQPAPPPTSHHRRRRRIKTNTTQSISGSSSSSVSGAINNNNKKSTKLEKHNMTSFQHGSEKHPSFAWIMMSAGLYVLSGVTQPLLMSYAKHAGLANPKCQLYMLFYYIGPASVAVTLRRRKKKKMGSTKKEEEEDQRQHLFSGSDNGSNETLQYVNNELHCDSGNGTSNDNYGSASISHDDKVIVGDEYEYEDEDEESLWPTFALMKQASYIAMFDIFAQSMCYTGNNLAGPTIFAIIYSSVTIWAAIYSQIFLSRSLSRHQWMGVCLVVLGLSLTAVDSLSSGEHVFAGACLIVVGSSFHGLTYVLCEKIMTPLPAMSSSPLQCRSESSTALLQHEHHVQTTTTTTTISLQPLAKKQYIRREEPNHISVRANCAIQGIVATVALLLWQIYYTLPRFDALVLTPMADAGTSIPNAVLILSGIALSNVLHSVTFFQTLKYFPGGATSAGVLKGLQAVLVFVVSSIVLCDRWGGREMCWSGSKFVSLIVVVGGIFYYALSTDVKKGAKNKSPGGGTDGGFISLRNANDEDITTRGDGVTICV